MTDYDQSLEEQNEQLRFKLAETEKLLDIAMRAPQLHWKHSVGAYSALNGNIYEEGYDLYLGKLVIGYMYKDDGIWQGKIFQETTAGFAGFKNHRELQAWMMDAFTIDQL